MIQNLSRFLFAVIAVAPMLATLSQAQSRQAMTHHMRESTRNGQARQMGRLSSEQTMNLDLVLPLRDPAGLDAFLKDIYNSASSNFRHYLTVAQFTDRFGPTQESYDAVLNFAKANGLQVVGGTRDGMEVQAKASVFAIENAFHIALGTYQHPTENRTFFSPDREPTPSLPCHV